MSQAKITVIGMYNFLKNENIDMFDGLLNDSNYPSEFAENIVENILWRDGEFEVLFAEPFFYRNAITNFFKTNKWSFLKMYNATLLTYNAIHNYDRTETEQIITDKSLENDISHTISASEQNSGTDTIEYDENETVTQSGSDTVESSGNIERTGRVTEKNNVSAYNSNNYSPKDEKINDYGEYNNDEWVNPLKDVSTGEETTNYGKQDDRSRHESQDMSYGKGVTKDSTETGIESTVGTDSTERQLHVAGNIGVMSTQNMLMQEFNIAMINIYNVIADLFADNLCVCTF